MMPCQTGRGKRRRLEWQLGSLAACARPSQGRGGGAGPGREASCRRPRGGARGCGDSSGPAPGHQCARLPAVGVARSPEDVLRVSPGCAAASRCPFPGPHPCSSRQLTPGPLSSLFPKRVPPPPSSWASGPVLFPCSHLLQKVRATCLNFAPKVAGCSWHAAVFKSRPAPDVLCVFGQNLNHLWPSFPSAGPRNRRLIDLSN